MKYTPICLGVVEMDFVAFTMGCWAVFAIYWWLASKRVARTIAVGQSPLVRVAALTTLAVSFALYYLPLSSVPVLGWPVLPHYVVLQVSGIVMCAFGIGFAIWARDVLGKNWSTAVTIKEGHTLVKDGPYSVVRHPIYFGFAIAAVGMVLALGEVRAFFMFFDIFGLTKKIDREESLLLSVFSDEYEQYQRKTKKLIPWIW
jgi:protein-S-isoprenylcysteine O-methyltransferase Ste14